MTSTIEPDLDEPRTRRITFGGVLAITVVIAIVAFWAYAFSPLAPDQKADGLQDGALVANANAHCKTANAQIDALPLAMDSATPAARSDVVVQANGYVAEMVDNLRADAAAATGRDRELLDLWFTDWDTYLERRDAYAQELRTSEDGAVFTVPARNGGQITQTMDGFARTNDLFDCLVPLDV